MNHPIFVFGSNLSGRHGKGAALDARNLHGAIYGKGIGRQGNSYAIPTKDASRELKVLPLGQIARYVDDFKEYARIHPELRFNITRVGCGLAAYKPADIAPLFRGAPLNCDLPDDFKEVILSLNMNSPAPASSILNSAPGHCVVATQPRRLKLF